MKADALQRNSNLDTDVASQYVTICGGPIFAANAIASLKS